MLFIGAKASFFYAEAGFFALDCTLLGTYCMHPRITSDGRSFRGVIEC